MLKIKNLQVAVDSRVILRDINLEIGEGEVHVLLGPNGVGKTTLLLSIMGMPGINVVGGNILFQGRDITHLPLEERAQLGIGIAFQRMPVVQGVKLRTLGEIILERHFQEVSLDAVAEKLNCKYLLERDLGAGFSGGEAKRAELFQLLLQRPLFAMIDEPESGVDLDNIALVGKALNELFERNQVRNKRRSGLIITHTGHILDYINADLGHVLIGGTIVCRGNPRDLLEDIKKSGYQNCLRCET